MYNPKGAKITEGYKKVIWGFVIVTILIVVIVVYFSAGKAVVKVEPKATIVKTDFVADIVTDGGLSTNADLQGVLFEKEVSGSTTGQATGSMVLEGESVGTVTLINKRTEDQVLVKTTRLLTPDNILFRLSDRVVIPAGGTLEASVYADDPTTFTEVQPTTFTIPGLWEGLQDKVYAESKAAIKKTGEAVKVVNKSDMDMVKDSFTQELISNAIAEIRAELPNQTFELIELETSVLENNFSVEENAQVETFDLDLSVKVKFLGVDRNEIIQLAAERLGTVVSSEQELANIDTNNFSYSIVNYDDQAQTARIKVHAEGEGVIKAGSEIFNKDKLVGLSAKGVELYLSNFPEVENVTVELAPFWMKKVPRMKDNVMIEIIKSE